MYGLLWSENIWKSAKKNLNIEKIIFKVVQMKFLAMHFNNQKLSFDIFTVGNLLDFNILMIWALKKMYNFDPYNVLLAISTNVLFMTAFVLQGHIYYSKNRSQY